jgi:type IV pilus assembly protein PilW
MHRLQLKKTDGFTLTELMVAMGIGMVMLAAVTTTFMSQTKIYNAQEQINEMEQNARGVLDIISREVKMAGYNPATAAVTGVTYSTSQLQIEADLDASGAISTSAADNERIVYVFDNVNKQITRKVGSGLAQVLADNITSFDISYYQADGTTPATTSSAIRQVKIDITARTAKPDPDYTSNNGYRTYQVFNTITPINLAL